VAFYSPMDVTTFSGADDPSTYGENELWEDLNSTQDIEMISPQQHLSASSPPVLSIVGTEDNYGLYPANKRFKQRADELGTKCVLLTIKGADHAYDGIPVGIATQMSLWAVERFLQLCIRTTQSEEGLI